MREAVLAGATVRVPEVRDAKAGRYVLVPLNAAAAANLVSDDVNASFDGPPAPPASGVIGIGDIVNVTIFEIDAGGLFLPAQSGVRSGNFVSLPNQQVSQAGTISVPYGGTIKVEGLSPQTAAATIQGRLEGRALEPQVVVSIVDRRANPVSVLGDVQTSAHFSLDPGGERLLGAVARAGGPKFEAYESMVYVQRLGGVRRALLSEVAENPNQNIQLAPGDSIYVAHEPRYFLALGATGAASTINLVDRRIAFSDSRISLADGLAKAGGVQDDLANARGVFVYRYEHRAVLTRLGVTDASLPVEVPTIYLLDMTEPAGYFYASRFNLRHNDVLYVSNAPATDLIKFLNVVFPGASSAAAVHAAMH